MLTSLSIANYRSICDLTMPLERLNVITGENGSGKSNLYKALRLLAEIAKGGVINSLAEEGGLASTYWAGPETLSAGMKRGDIPIEGVLRNHALRLKLGFASEHFGYAITLGLPGPSLSAFSHDPEIKREVIFNGAYYRPASSLIERKGNLVKIREDKQWQLASQKVPVYDSMFDQLADPRTTPEVFQVRETIRNWRFYDNFRTDKDAPARHIHLLTRTPVLHQDGRDLASAIQTIVEIGDKLALMHAIDDAFPGCRLEVIQHNEGQFSLVFHQKGLLRPLSAAELSDGTLRFILWVAALLTPRPPELMVLNEPETSLHPDLMPALARLILQASRHSQIWVISHSSRLVNVLIRDPDCLAIELEKELGQTRIRGQKILDIPIWHWPGK
ncbi:AAA family ATPase [Candidatus Regiella insecticola]|uniref:ATP-binding protein n=1 Tax=Candidatus Regiella insecticola TaxID=138073 RepID=A0A6L2ZN00_9ENTR|nr:AAA family ATPase [Candidatus Regiella insecticola]GFN45794.1 ATP-binding protein [Candidatus Regiella insecticola]